MLGDAHLRRTLLWSLCLLCAFGVSTWVVEPLTERLSPDTAVNAILLYLPHGVRVIAAWLFGWKSAAYLLPANLAYFATLTGGEMSGLSIALLLGAVSISAPLAFQILAFFGFDLRADPVLRFNWRSVVFAGGMASAINAISLHVINFHDIPSDEHLAGIAFWVTGDVLGVVAVLLVLLAGDRALRRRFPGDGMRD